MNRTVITLVAGMSCLVAVPAFGFEVSSPAVGKDKKIPDKYIATSAVGCSGNNLSLPLAWKNPPAGAKSFALTLFDQDAPTGSGFWHWTVVNLPANTTELPEGAGEPGNAKLPQGALQGRNDAGFAGYLGPCPPPGKAHRYLVTVYALKADKLNVDKDSSGALVGFNINANMLGKAATTFTYQRK